MNMIPALKRKFLMAVHNEAEQLEVDAVDKTDKGPQMMVAAAIIARVNCLLWNCDAIDDNIISAILEQEVPDPQIREYVRPGLDRAFKTLEMN